MRSLQKRRTIIGNSKLNYEGGCKKFLKYLYNLLSKIELCATIHMCNSMATKGKNFLARPAEWHNQGRKGEL